MALPEAKTKILEDGAEALLEGSVEPVGEGEEVEGVEFADLSKVTIEPEQKPEAKPAEKKPAAAKPAAADGDEEIPEELRGKTPAQLAKMYREAHATIGRQGTELGELRRKADLFIQASLAQAMRKPQPEAKPKEEAPKPLEDVDFFAKPTEAIARAIADNPIIKEIRESLGKSAADRAEAQALAATERFNATHPDAPEIMKDPEFRQWVGASPIRRQLLTRAHQRYDFAAGDEVFSTWKALRGTKTAKTTDGEGEGATQPTEAEVKAAASTLARAKSAKAQTEAAAKAAAAPTGGASAGKQQGSKKIYRRADVMRLMEEDPDRYQELAPELDAAYREGRVR